MEAWLHTQGYSYIGPNSFYLLTMAEIARLQRGFAKLNEDGVAKPRDSDLRALAGMNAKLEGRG